MMNRLPNKKDVASQLLAGISNIEIEAGRVGGSMRVRFKLTGGVEWDDDDPASEQQAWAFVQDVLNSFQGRS